MGIVFFGGAIGTFVDNVDIVARHANVFKHASIDANKVAEIFSVHVCSCFAKIICKIFTESLYGFVNVLTDLKAALMNAGADTRVNILRLYTI